MMPGLLIHVMSMQFKWPYLVKQHDRCGIGVDPLGRRGQWLEGDRTGIRGYHDLIGYVFWG